MKILQVVGARPQFVKLAPLSKLARARGFCEIIVHSGQHYDIQMNEVFFRDMEIPAPSYNLSVGSGTQAVQTGEILALIEPILIKEKPDYVIVYGDTNTTLAGALAAVKLGIKTAHVEACLRSYNRSMPEEINRIVVDHISDTLLAPTPQAMENALHEGLADKCVLVGDIMVDSLAFGINKARAESKILAELKLQAGDPYYLLTLHRPYNVDNPANLEHILSKLDSLGTRIIFPVHPRTRQILLELEHKQFRNISFVAPQAYLDFLLLMDNAELVLSDSGGIQKEAYILGKPCVTLRPETEWVETVQSGWNMLLPTDSADFPKRVLGFKPPQARPDLFGKDVSKKILETLELSFML